MSSEIPPQRTHVMSRSSVLMLFGTFGEYFE
jgi:hypothetical protein